MSARGALDAIRRLIDKRVAEVEPFVATVTGVSGGLVAIRRPEAATADGVSYARLAGFAVAVDDEVVCLPMRGVPWVIGKNQRSAPAGYALDAALTVPALNTPVVYHNASNTSATLSTTDTVNYSNALLDSITLPTGTWTLAGIGGALFEHSANGAASMHLYLAGSGTGRLVTVPSSGWTALVDDGEQAGLSGGVSVGIRFRSGDAGTTTCKAPWYLVVATRTA